MPNRPKLSLWEHATLVGAIGNILVSLLSASIAGLLRGSNGAPTYGRHLYYSLTKALSGSMSTRQMQALAPSTQDGYKSFAKSNKFQPDIVKLKDGDETAALWIGDKYAKNTILYLHGGGFAAYANPAQFQLLWNSIEKVKARGGEVAAFVVEYDLAPGAKYPRQVGQAILALEYLTKVAGKKYSQDHVEIVLGGDSAGANLALAVLSHLMHPHPSLPAFAPSVSDNKLKGVFLISPWVTFSQTSQSLQSNASKDVLDAKVLKQWSEAYMSNANTDEYNTPSHAITEWWDDVPVENMLVTTGGDELFRDDILEFGHRIQVCFNTSLSTRHT
ncbi:putative acetyl-hydrolase [Pyrenochaeta sp. MPI-SDFR-AT-0127]|nr:putative acetyl-hydrolase [Pyrenochaeta sp. MPI-SDFR-AT-0127]